MPPLPVIEMCWRASQGQGAFSSRRLTLPCGDSLQRRLRRHLSVWDHDRVRHLECWQPPFRRPVARPRDGRILVNGRALEETDLWRRDHTYPNADLVDVLATAGVRSEKVTLAAVRNGELKAILARLANVGDVVAICDAETEHDLHLIAEAGLHASPASVFIGSAGLAHALASLDVAESVEPLRIPTSKFGTLTVVGSLADASRSAARSFERNRDCGLFPDRAGNIA